MCIRDRVTSYPTLPIVFGHTTTKILLTVLILVNYWPIYCFIHSGLGLMIHYYYWNVMFLGFVVLLLW